MLFFSLWKRDVLFFVPFLGWCCFQQRSVHVLYAVWNNNNNNKLAILKRLLHTGHGTLYLQSMGLQRVGHDWATELKWTCICMGSCGCESHKILFRQSSTVRKCVRSQSLESRDWPPSGLVHSEAPRYQPRLKIPSVFLSYCLRTVGPTKERPKLAQAFPSLTSHCGGDGFSRNSKAFSSWGGMGAGTPRPTQVCSR